MTSTEIINNNGEECSGKMKEIHDGVSAVGCPHLALSRRRGNTRDYSNLARRLMSDWIAPAVTSPGPRITSGLSRYQRLSIAKTLSQGSSAASGCSGRTARFTVGLETRHIAQHQPHLVCGFQTLQHLLVQFITVFKEVINGSFLAACGTSDSTRTAPGSMS